jgi:hypothetical protein
VRSEGNEFEFVKWLCERLGLSTLPRLIRNGELTEEFHFFTTHATSDLLVLLRDNWNYYERQMYDLVGPNSARTTVMKHLSAMRVKCIDGSTCGLGKTVLPLDNLKVVAGLLPFLDVQVPSDPRWLKFEALGVIVEESLDLFLRQLKALARLVPLQPHQVNISDVCDIYRELTARSRSDLNSLK